MPLCLPIHASVAGDSAAEDDADSDADSFAAHIAGSDFLLRRPNRTASDSEDAAGIPIHVCAAGIG